MDSVKQKELRVEISRLKEEQFKYLSKSGSVVLGMLAIDVIGKDSSAVILQALQPLLLATACGVAMFIVTGLAILLYTDAIPNRKISEREKRNEKHIQRVKNINFVGFLFGGGAFFVCLSIGVFLWVFDRLCETTEVTRGDLPIVQITPYIFPVIIFILAVALLLETVFGCITRLIRIIRLIRRRAVRRSRRQSSAQDPS